MAKLTAHLHRSTSKKRHYYYTTIVSRNGEIIYTGEMIDNPGSALKAPKAIAAALNPWYVDHTGWSHEMVDNKPVKLNLSDNKLYKKPKLKRKSSPTDIQRINESYNGCNLK